MNRQQKTIRPGLPQRIRMFGVCILLAACSLDETRRGQAAAVMLAVRILPAAPDGPAGGLVTTRLGAELVNCPAELRRRAGHPRPYGLLVRFTVRNNTGRDVFFYGPHIKVLEETDGVYGPPASGSDMEMAFTPPCLENPADMAVRAPGPADEKLARAMLESMKARQRRPNTTETAGFQGRLFTTSFLFLKAGSEATLIQSFGRYLYSSQETHLKLFLHFFQGDPVWYAMLGDIPPSFQGYEHYEGTVRSDTVHLVVKTR